MEVYQMIGQGQFGVAGELPQYLSLKAFKQLAANDRQRYDLMMSVFRDSQDRGLVSERIVGIMEDNRPRVMDPAWKRNVATPSRPGRKQQ